MGDHTEQIQGFVMLHLRKYFAFTKNDLICYNYVLSFYEIFSCGRKPEQEYSFQGFFICFHALFSNNWMCVAMLCKTQEPFVNFDNISKSLGDCLPYRLNV